MRCKEIIKKGLLYMGILCGMLSLSTATHAIEPISISHTLAGYTDDGPTITLKFTLDITNNGAIPLKNAEVSVGGPMYDIFIETLSDHIPLSVGDIPAYGSPLVTYSIKSIFILPREDVAGFPILWEVRYLDDSGEEHLIIVEGKPTSSQ